MASEIRVDKINSLSGVGTVTLSPTGVDIAGITTAATLRATTGIVTSLTAGSLTSLGAVSGTTGTFSGAVSGTTGTFSAAVSGTTGTFSGAVSGTTGTFTGDVDIADKIVHTGDTDTAIRFPSANTVTVEAAGVQKLSLSTGEVVFNDTGADCDFRIEGDTNANLVKVDAGNDRVGVGLAAPQQVFHVYHASDNGLALFESGDANCRIDLKDNSGQVSLEAVGDNLLFGTSSSNTCLLYTSPSPRDISGSRMPSSA